MYETQTSIQRDNRSYQAEIARSLLETMEREDAIDFCVSNQWAGVLAQLMKH